MAVDRQATITLSLTGTLKTREWKTADHEKYGGGKRGIGKRGTKFSRVEKAGPPSMERETDKYRCTVFIETLSNIILYATILCSVIVTDTVYEHN